jgi:hypothetical protein
VSAAKLAPNRKAANMCHALLTAVLLQMGVQAAVMLLFL